MPRKFLRLLSFFGVLSVSSFSGIQAAQAQAWWDSYQHGPREVEDGFLPTPSIATSLPNKVNRPGTASARRTRHRLWSGIHQRHPLERAWRVPKQAPSTRKASWHPDRRSRQARRLEGLTFFANVFQIHNTGRLRRDYVGGINTIAAIEGLSTTRLSELG